MSGITRQATRAILGLLLVVGSFICTRSAIPAAAQEEMTSVEIVEQVVPAVVSVYNGTLDSGIGGEARVQGSGSGFIISEDGYIVTNWHVVAGGDVFQVVLWDGTPLEAELIGIDPRDDLAVLRIDPAEVPAVVTFGDSDALRLGEEVIAIGSPGTAGGMFFGNTVTAGIISGVGRNQFAPEDSSVCQGDYWNLLQHDAAINPGNSGGPLFNMQGEVVGVNTMVATNTQGLQMQGLGFAVPSNTVAVMVRQIIEDGAVRPAYLGASYYELSPGLARMYDLPVQHGALVFEVAVDSPAEQAGLQGDDIIIAVNGIDISQDQSFDELMMLLKPGDLATFTVLAGGETFEVQTVLGESELDFSECINQPAVP